MYRQCQVLFLDDKEWWDYNIQKQIIMEYAISFEINKGLI